MQRRTFAGLCAAGVLQIPIARAFGQRPAGRTGEFTLEATAQSLVDPRVDGYDDILDTQRMQTWDVYVPPNVTALPGVMVYVSPREEEAAPDRWRRVLDEHNLVWICARRSGNDYPRAHRVLLAMLALRVLSRETLYDADRVYIGGFSGGAHTASVAAAHFPALFKGGLYIAGAFWRDADDPNALSIMRENRFVFITGHADPNRERARRVFRRYRFAGIENLLFIDLPHLAHQEPGMREFGRAVRFLDGG